MSDISKIKLPNGDIYNLKDSSALHQGDATTGAIEGITKQDNNLITILDGAKDYPIEELEINFGPYQEGNGDPSPENIRSIMGWTGATIFKSEKNLFNSTITTEPGVILADGTIGDNSGYKYTAEYIPIKGNTDYYLSGTVIQAESAYASIAFYDINKNFLERYTPQKGLPSYGAFVSPVDARYIRLNINNRSNTMENIQLERGLISTNYTNINQIFNIQFPIEAGTVYGGTLDVTNGTLTVTYKKVKFQELPVGYNNQGYFYATVSDKANGVFNIVSEIYKNVNTGAAEMPDYSISGTASNQNVFIMDKRYSNINDLLAAVGDTYVAYEFASPVIYQLTPQQINTVLGENNIWTNINSTISIKYAADTKLFIQQNAVKDVQINNTSIINNGVANIPLASTTTVGAVKLGDTMSITGSGAINFRAVGASEVKAGTSYQRALSPERQHASVFYGLTKAAGVDMKNSGNAIGVYTDEAKAAIQHMIGTDAAIAPYEANITADRSYAIGDTFMMSGKLYKATAAIAQGGVITPNTNCVETTLDDNRIKDIQINNVSIINNKIANIPVASTTDFGIIRLGMLNNSIPSGIAIDTSGKLFIRQAYSNEIPAGSLQHPPITPSTQHISTFYGLAKAAGDTTQAASSNAIGIYTNQAKTAIQAMLGVGTMDETITSTTPTINAVANHRYKCGEVSLLDFIPCTYGICEVIFTSGSTPTVLTLPNAVKMPQWFDIDVNRIYDIIITDGIYGAVTSWAV